MFPIPHVLHVISCKSMFNAQPPLTIEPGSATTDSSNGPSTLTIVAVANGQPQGTSQKFTPILGYGEMTNEGIICVVRTRLQCITCMPQFEDRSLEELRFQDYQIAHSARRLLVKMFDPAQPFDQLPASTIFPELQAIGTFYSVGRRPKPTTSSCWNPLPQPQQQTYSLKFKRERNSSESIIDEEDFNVNYQLQDNNCGLITVDDWCSISCKGKCGTFVTGNNCDIKLDKDNCGTIFYKANSELGFVKDKHGNITSVLGMFLGEVKGYCGKMYVIDIGNKNTVISSNSTDNVELVILGESTVPKSPTMQHSKMKAAALAARLWKFFNWLVPKVKVKIMIKVYSVPVPGAAVLRIKTRLKLDIRVGKRR